jgi:hypothetical protein
MGRTLVSGAGCRAVKLTAVPHLAMDLELNLLCKVCAASTRHQLLCEHQLLKAIWWHGKQGVLGPHVTSLYNAS